MKKIVAALMLIISVLCIAGCEASDTPREVSDLKISVEYSGKTIEGLYSGTVVDGIPNGTGKFETSATDETFTYEGQWSDGKITGEGKLDASGFSVFVGNGNERIGEFHGEVLDGVPSGTGSYSSKNSEGEKWVYTGMWQNGMFNGQGETVWDDSKFITQTGNYKDGVFSPSVAEFFGILSKFEDAKFNISDNAKKYLAENPQEFISNTVEEGKETDTEFSYAAFSKNPSKFGDKLIILKNLFVKQIFEYSFLELDCTFILARDNDYKYYYIYLYGEATDVYEGNKITLTALPLDYFTFKNSAGSETWSIALAGVSAKK